MSLAAFGTVVNIFGVITFGKDVGDVLKGVAESIDEVGHRRILTATYQLKA